MVRSAKLKLLLVGFTLVLLAWLVWFIWPTPQAELIHGDVEVREIKVASKVPGRVVKLHVQTGDWVETGDLLIELTSPELAAKRAQADAAEAATLAQLDEAQAGLRQEEIEMARLDWQKALVQQNLLNTTLARLTNLHAEGLLSQQQLDEAQAKTKAATDQASQAEARYNMAAQGARSEQLRAIQAQNRRAAAAVAEVEAYQQELKLYAPRTARVASLVVYEGELAGSGYPIITLADTTDIWVTFHIREDKLKTLAVGQSLEAFVPALNQHLTFKVTQLNALPSFAQWKQVQGTPGYDLKTFQLEARPVTPEPKLQAGMTVIFSVAP